MILSAKPTDIAKDAIRIATTAGLDKDVIDLLKDKVALLTEKIAALEQENALLKSENSNLGKKMTNLEQKPQGSKPQSEIFEKDTERIIDFLFDHAIPGGHDIRWVGQQLGLSTEMSDYHYNILESAGMLESEGYGVGLSSKGKAYAVEVLGKK